MRSLPFVAVLSLVSLVSTVSRAQEGPAAPPAEGPVAPPAVPEDKPPGEAELAPVEPGHDGAVGEPFAPSPGAELGEAELAASLHLRKGFFGGATFGAGGLNAKCEGCADYDAIGFSFDAGWALNEKWGVVLELFFTGGVGSEELQGDAVAGQLFQFGIAGRYWPLERLWLQAGLASGSFSLIREGADDPIRKASGVGVTFAAGVDLWRSASRHIVVDLRARLGFFGLEQSDGTDTFDDSYGVTQKGVLFGVSWY